MPDGKGKIRQHLKQNNRLSDELIQLAFHQRLRRTTISGKTFYYMKTLKYAWLGLLIVIIIVLFGLKKFPGIISYDYYYRYLNIYVNINTASMNDIKQGESVSDAIIDIIKKDIKYPLDTEFTKQPKKVTGKDGISVTLNLKFKNFHDCYMYLLHHRSEDTKILPQTEITKSQFVRKTKLTYVKQTGKYENKEENLSGAAEVSAVCRF